MLSNDVQLKDWEIEEKHLENVLKVNKNIFEKPKKYRSHTC